MGVYFLKMGHELLLAQNIEFISVNFKMIRQRCDIERSYISQYTVIHNENKFLKIYLI